ncbi:3-isopropylmalate dehydratase small subunit [Hyphomonas sp.]|uniref:3-isopropylmalate dehydratase small subunit n=1 Tax=Hyphomonas sp. TaxID=87 RepID=UPI001D9B27DC|nr:3-isopropylmalate dehydratase small subunit [Hyphomonas sp.]
MQQPFVLHSGRAAPMMQDNIDTDQIIPSREMKTVGRTGLADGLFAGWRYKTTTDRTPDPAFVLNQREYSGTSILVAGENFGCGSSREHAVWALAEYGIRAIIAPSFGAIFQGNCPRNGIAPIVLAGEDVTWLAAQLPGDVSIDLPTQTVSCADHQFRFELDGFAKRLLIEGLDPIALTLKSATQIAAYQAADCEQRPWLYID